MSEDKKIYIGPENWKTEPEKEKNSSEISVEESQPEVPSPTEETGKVQAKSDVFLKSQGDGSSLKSTKKKESGDDRKTAPPVFSEMKEKQKKKTEKKARRKKKKGWRKFLIILLIVLASLLLLSYILTYKASEKFQIQFGDKITSYAEKYGLDPWMVAGIVRAESDFQETVVADDGGMGLMQLMPDTAKWCALKLGIDYDEKALLTVDYNLNMGCFYLSQLFQKYQSQNLAQAAYNAGPRVVDEWISTGRISREEQTMKNIPYDITRNYVFRVNRAKKVYGIFYPEGLPDSSTRENMASQAASNWRNTLSWAFAW